MILGLVGGFIALGCFILFLTGLGILTTAIFTIRDGKEQQLKTLGTPAKAAVAAVPAGHGILPVQPQDAVPEVPAVFALADVKIINITDPSIVVSKISIIIVWIFIVMSMFGFFLI